MFEWLANCLCGTRDKQIEAAVRQINRSLSRPRAKYSLFDFILIMDFGYYGHIIILALETLCFVCT